jgi:hypothetical protein
VHSGSARTLSLSHTHTLSLSLSLCPSVLRPHSATERIAQQEKKKAEQLELAEKLRQERLAKKDAERESRRVLKEEARRKKEEERKVRQWLLGGWIHVRLTRGQKREQEAARTQKAMEELLTEVPSRALFMCFITIDFVPEGRALCVARASLPR